MNGRHWEIWESTTWTWTILHHWPFLDVIFCLFIFQVKFNGLYFNVLSWLKTNESLHCGRINCWLLIFWIKQLWYYSCTSGHCLYPSLFVQIIHKLIPVQVDACSLYIRVFLTWLFTKNQENCIRKKKSNSDSDSHDSSVGMILCVAILSAVWLT